MAGRVIVGVDGSPNGREALRFALAEAALRGAPLDVVHAWSIPPLTTTGLGMIPAFDLVREELADAARLALDHALEEAGAGAVDVEVVRHVVQGDAAGALVERASEGDLLVVGSRGHGSLAGALLGSVSRACLHHAPCPVAVVHDAGPTERTRIVVGVDGSAGSEAALRWVWSEALLRGVAVLAVSTYEEPWELVTALIASPEAADELRGAFAAQAERVVEQAFDGAPADVGVTTETIQGPAGPSLVTVGEGSSLLAVGSRGRGGFRSLLLGSVSEHCASRSRGVVVVVR